MMWLLPLIRRVFRGSKRFETVDAPRKRSPRRGPVGLEKLEERILLSNNSFPTPLTPVSPLDALVYAGYQTARLDPGVTDSWTLRVGQHQTLSALVQPLDPGLQPVVRLDDPSAAPLAESSAPAPGQPAVIQIVPALAGGVYQVDVRSLAAAGNYRLTLFVNAAVEGETYTGTANDTAASAQNIDGSSVPLQGAADRLAAAGVGDGATPDLYAFTLAAGQFASLKVTSQTGGAPALALLGPGAGNPLLTLGETDGSGQAVFDFKAPAAGTYFARVLGAAGDPYSLLVTRGASLPRAAAERTDPAGTGQDLTATGQALGYTGSAVTDAAGVQTPLPLTLTDGQGYQWDLQEDGSVNSGTDNVYDGGQYLEIRNFFGEGTSYGYFHGAPTADVRGGRTVVYGQETDANVALARKVYVPADQGFARYLETISNPGTSTVNVTVSVYSYLGPEYGIQIDRTSDGDTDFTTADDWLITHDQNDPARPTLLHVVAGPDGQRPSSVYVDYWGYLQLDYDLTLAPGESKVGSSRVDLQACKLEYSIVSPK